MLATALLLGLTGLAGAFVLYLTARRFHVEEDPRIDNIESLLPGANCGACGCRGCRDFAATCVQRNSLENLNCPGAREGTMKEIASIMGVETQPEAKRLVAVLRCAGSCKVRPIRYTYDGASNCAVMNAVGVGSHECSWGCLACGDCTSACRFGALKIDPGTGLPLVDTSMCTGCGLCVDECPRSLLELRPAGRRERRVWVACSSHDRGAVARRQCKAACIGCGKCAKECPFDAITLAGNLAYINPDKCKTCGKCVATCPTGAIHATFEIKQPS